MLRGYAGTLPWTVRYIGEACRYDDLEQGDRRLRLPQRVLRRPAPDPEAGLRGLRRMAGVRRHHDRAHVLRRADQHRRDALPDEGVVRTVAATVRPGGRTVEHLVDQ